MPKAKPKARKRKPAPPVPVPAVLSRGEKHRVAEATRRRVITSEARDISEDYPEIADPKRRASCEHDLRRFCDTYNPEAFSLPWSGDQIESIARIEEAVRLGALYAFAEARGSGKTTRVRMAALWALSYGHCRYAFVIGATDSKAADTLSAVKLFMRFLPVYAADFPEIAYPVQRLEGIAHRAAGQTFGGQSTMIEWTADRIVLPTVPPPANWPAAWKDRLRPDGMVPTSGAVFSTSGLTGEGIRGSLKTLTTGEQVRPDFVLLDDPQTSESAGSVTQNQKREQLISADVLGMAGPGKQIGVVMPCTIIAPGDAMDRMTDRGVHPLWRGQRSGILRSMPTNLEAWDEYFEVYRRCAQKEPPDFAEAHEFYRARREVLDAGAEASWDARKLPGEVSAVQHAMNLYCRDRRAFMSEYMNRPDPIDLGAMDDLDPADICRKVNGLPRGTVPASSSRVTAFIDCGSSILFWCVVGWDEGFSGSVIDYGTFPKQNRSYFAADDARPALTDLPHLQNLAEDARVYAGLKETVAAVLGRAWPRQGGGEAQIDRCLVDSGKWTKAVSQFCHASAYRAVLTPSKGWGMGSGRTPMANWPVQPGERRPGDHWRDRVNREGVGRLVTFDANEYKSRTARALAAPPMSAGCITLFGDDKSDHRLFADHLTAEYRPVVARAKSGDQSEQELWSMKPGRKDNHFFDALVGAMVAASVCGLRWDAAAAAGDRVPPREKKKVRLSDLFHAKHGGRS